MEILVLFLLILINGFFALSEIALVSSKRPRLEQMKSRGSNGAKIALRLLNNSENFLSAIQVGITLIGIVTGVYGGMKFADDLAPFFEQYAFARPYANEIALTLVVILITYVSIVIGELVPKTIALSNPEKIVVTVAPAIQYFSTLFYPFVKLLSFSTSLFNRVLRIKKQSEYMTEAELRQMIKIASHEGVIQKEQNLIHEKVFYFSDKRARHIMTHRRDVEWLDIEKSEDQIRQAILKSKHSQLVAGRQSLDNFIGILSVREYFMETSANASPDISALVTEPLIVPENMEAQKVLNLFRQKQKYMSFVVNEYGSFEGIITLHDIMESIIGDLPGEGDQEEPEVFVREDKSVLVSGEASIERLTEIIENFVIDYEEMDYSTIAGFVFHHLNKIPQTGDRFTFGEYLFEIVDMDGNRIDKVIIKRNE